MEKITYLPFYFSIGDHRGIIIDIPEEELLGNRVMKIQRPHARRLMTKCPEIKKRYLEKLEVYTEKLGLQKKLIKLRKNILHFSLTQISDQLNEIDKLKSQAMELAEKRCRRLHMGVVPYFPGLALKAQTIVFWIMMYRRKLGAKIKMKVLR